MLLKLSDHATDIVCPVGTQIGTDNTEENGTDRDKHWSGMKTDHCSTRATEEEQQSCFV